MKSIRSHSWNLSPKQAIELQKDSASQVVVEDDFGAIRVVAGADMSIDVDRRTGYSAVVLFEFPSLKEIDRIGVAAPLTFPYVPGLLSFREGPVLLKAFERLRLKPDLIFFDGQGIAHPRRLGIASHMGLVLDCPTIGCAKSLLCGHYKEPGPRQGQWAPLEDRGEVIGAILRSRTTVKPIFVSPGHRIGLDSAIRFTLQCCDGLRIPKPTRLADRWADQIKVSNYSLL